MIIGQVVSRMVKSMVSEARQSSVQGFVDYML